MYILDTIYNDYDITYKTNINENVIPILIMIGLLCALILFFFITLMRVYKKANRSGISAIIPFYNCIVLMEIINEPKWKFLLLIIPGINIIYFCIFMYQLAKCFRKNQFYCILTALFPLIMIPILSFGNSEYIGINEEAMLGVSIAKELPVDTGKKPTLSNPDQPIKERTKVNMSIGGGVYQKEYRDSLLEAKSIKKPVEDGIADFRVDRSELPLEDSSQNGIDLLQNVAFVETDTNSSSSPVDSLLQVQSVGSVMTPTEASMEESSSSSSQEGGTPSSNSSVEFSVNHMMEPPVSLPEVAVSSNSSKDFLISPVVSSNDSNPSILSVPVISSEVEKPDLLVSSSSSVQNVESSSISSPEPEFIQCPYCGAKVRSNAKKCFMCGKEL